MDRQELVLSDALLRAGNYKLVANVTIRELAVPLVGSQSMEIVIISAPLYAFIAGGETNKMP